MADKTCVKARGHAWGITPPLWVLAAVVLWTPLVTGAQQQSANPRAGWHETIIDARIALEDKLTRTLRRDLQRRLPKLYEQARHAAGGSLLLRGEPEVAEALPAACPYRLADVLSYDWYPSSRHGLKP